MKLYDMPKVQNRSRAYNNLFTFTAMKHDITHPTGQGVGMLRMGGRTLHYQKCVSEMNTVRYAVVAVMLVRLLVIFPVAALVGVGFGQS